MQIQSKLEQRKQGQKNLRNGKRCALVLRERCFCNRSGRKSGL